MRACELRDDPSIEHHDVTLEFKYGDGGGPQVSAFVQTADADNLSPQLQCVAWDASGAQPQSKPVHGDMADALTFTTLFPEAFGTIQPEQTHAIRFEKPEGPEEELRKLGAWARRVRARCGERLQPYMLMGLAKNREAVPGAEQAPQAEVEKAIASLQLLLDKAMNSSDLRMATFLDEVAAPVEAHKCLHAAALDHGAFVAAAGEAFDQAAIGDITYTNALCASQLAVAQRRLTLLCERFWRELGRREHVTLSAPGLANVYHAYAALARQRKAAGIAAADALCSKLEERAVDLKGAFNLQEAANCLCAAATLERGLTGRVREGLLAAARHTAPGMKPQGVANTLWAFAKLDCKPDSECFAALLASAERTAPRMNQQMLQRACGPSPSSTQRRWRARCGARCCRRPSARRRA